MILASKWLSLFALMASVAISPSLRADVEHSVGIARDAQDQSLTYVEHHQYLPTGEHLVSYFDHNGEVLVTKSITYPGLLQHPEVIQTDFTQGLTVETRIASQTIQMTRNRSGQVETFDFPLHPTTIVDAGFDNFLGSIGQSFSEKESRVYKLAVAGGDSLLKVQITKQQSPGKKLSFTIKPKNFFIRLLVPEMRLQYDEQGRLLAYEGLTNLNLAAEKNRSVIIDFSRYTTSDKLDKPLTQWLTKP